MLYVYLCTWSACAEFVVTIGSGNINSQLSLLDQRRIRVWSVCLQELHCRQEVSREDLRPGGAPPALRFRLLPDQWLETAAGEVDGVGERPAGEISICTLFNQPNYLHTGRFDSPKLTDFYTRTMPRRQLFK